MQANFPWKFADSNSVGYKKIVFWSEKYLYKIRSTLINNLVKLDTIYFEGNSIVKFDFLDKGNFSFQLINDGKDSTSFSSEIVKVKKGDTLKIECLPRGGFVGLVK